MLNLKNYLFILIAIVAITLSGCQKKPAASFTTDKEIYSNGDYMQLTNTSSNAHSYSWVVKGPKEYRSDTRDPSVLMDKVGTYEISMSCYSKNGKFSGKVSKSVEVVASIGQYVFYTDDLGSNATSAKVYIDNIYIGTITQNSGSIIPACGATGCVTTSIPQGLHDVRITFMPYNLNKIYYDMSFTNRGCNPFRANL